MTAKVTRYWVSETAKVRYGRHEEEVERRDAQDRGEERRAPPVPRGDRDDAEQVDHDDVGQLEERGT